MAHTSITGTRRVECAAIVYIANRRIDPQNAIVAQKDKTLSELEVHTRLLLLSLKLRKVPEDADNHAAHSANPRSKEPPQGVRFALISSGDPRTFLPKVRSCISVNITLQGQDYRKTN